MAVSEKSKIIYLLILIVFLAGLGIFWLDYIDLVNISKHIRVFKSEPALVVDASGDEPSLIEKEEFEKEKDKILERIEELDKREALIAEREKQLESEKDEIEQKKKGLELEKKKLEDERKKDSGYRKNVQVLANKMANMPPEESVKIMVNWEDPLIIDVLRQMDADSAAAGRMSITSYLITLFPKEKASRIMYLMTQL
ncbi:MAG TPA: flagellar protein FlbB [Spirochaetota bacterium]|nr:flagellar protein FlbB [Spirochaetota bacterium]HPJ33597.1 flagellar protein FlbB [Spirochaetota bacterium]